MSRHHCVAIQLRLPVCHLKTEVFFFFFCTSTSNQQMMIDVVPVLPDIPLPLIQPNYRPLPSIDYTPLSPPKRKGKFTEMLAWVLNIFV